MKEESLDRMASGRGKGAWLKISTALSCQGVAVYLIQLCMCRLTKPFSWFHPLLPDIHQFGLYTVPDRTSQFAFIKASSSKKKDRDFSRVVHKRESTICRRINYLSFLCGPNSDCPSPC